MVFTNTSDLEESRAFYGGVLELPLVLEQAGFVLIFQSSRDSFLGVCLRGSREASDTTGAIPTLVCDTPAAVDRWQAKLQAKGDKGMPRTLSSSAVHDLQKALFDVETKNLQQDFTQLGLGLSGASETNLAASIDVAKDRIPENNAF